MATDGDQAREVQKELAKLSDKAAELGQELKMLRKRFDLISERYPLSEVDVVFEKIQSDSLRMLIRASAEDALVKSPLIKIGRTALIIVAVLVFGGTIFGGVQIRSVQQQAQQTISQLQQIERDVKEADTSLRNLLDERTAEVREVSRNAVEDIKDADTSLRNLLDERTAEVREASRNAVEDIADTQTSTLADLRQQSQDTSDRLRAIEKEAVDAGAAFDEFVVSQEEKPKLEAEAAVQEIKDAQTIALAEIEERKTEALKRLDVDGIPNISDLKEELNALNQETGKLNSRALSSIIDVSIYAIYGSIALSLAALGISTVTAILVYRRA